MQDKLVSIGKGALIAGAGAALAYALMGLTTAANAGELGVYGPLIAASAAVLVNAIRKLLLSDAEQQDPPPPPPPYIGV